MKIRHAGSAADIMKCFEVMHELRPHLEKESFVALISNMMQRGYQIAYIEDNGMVVCASGFRLTDHLAWEKPLYIDDLSTLPASRGKGFASALLDYIFEYARSKGCTQVHLDSGCNKDRYDAHRLYLKKGFNITSHHFAKNLE